MEFIKRAIAPNEIKDALKVLEEMEKEYNNGAFKIARKYIEETITSKSDEFVNLIQKGTDFRKWTLGVMCNYCGDILESGECHIYRGVLNPMGPGNDLLKLFDTAIDELAMTGVIDNARAEKEKRQLRNNINDVG